MMTKINGAWVDGKYLIKQKEYFKDGLFRYALSGQYHFFVILKKKSRVETRLNLSSGSTNQHFDYLNAH